MTRVDQLKRVFLDTAPLIYYIEKNEKYLYAVVPIFERIDQGTLEAVTSPITLAECLVLPYRRKRLDLASRFFERIISARNTTYVSLNPEIARQAADLRARYSLSLDDAFQLAVCLASGCDGFLTNDRELERVKEANVLVVEEIR